MELPKDASLLRIFLQEADENNGEPLFSKIVLQAREKKLAGATVLRGPLGIGRSGKLHSSDIFHPSGGLPVVIEIVDSEQKIRAFLADMEDLLGSSLMTLEKVQAFQLGQE
jgi:PII-like signaling protein